MKRFWMVKNRARQVDVVRAMDSRERAFATGPRGEINSRYALEWVIDQLSRDDQSSGKLVTRSNR